ncbi:OCIA domain-containing protein 1 [Daktulosphaira vitifoliae]|uniref:OCIA domain-containing protein 1 n=1 Tax=Daktulosphaira vitifoliae TaxID=58002 RepID=UPI0021A99CA7|nr:OCIA domain-containing protein 1 [Daktulosphaira vitifoliae]
MENPSPVAYRPQQQKPSPESLFYQFSPDEKRVMKECNRESFFQRSLPLSAILGVGSYMAVNKGYFKASPKWGPWPKVIVGGLVGYIVGKYSYQNKCAEKLMQLPDSEVGRLLRERRGQIRGDYNEGNGGSPNMIPGNTYSLTEYNQNIDTDFQKPMNTLDTDYRPDYDTVSFDRLNEIPIPSSNVTTSYDDLRAQNRKEYERSFSKSNYKASQPNSQPIWDSSQSNQRNSSTPGESFNQYGDIFTQTK